MIALSMCSVEITSVRNDKHPAITTVEHITQTIKTSHLPQALDPVLSKLLLKRLEREKAAGEAEAQQARRRTAAAYGRFPEGAHWCKFLKIQGCGRKAGCLPKAVNLVSAFLYQQASVR